jgi:hypothetical protein
MDDLFELATDPSTTEAVLLELIEIHKNCLGDTECCYIEDEDVSLLDELAEYGSISEAIVDAYLEGYQWESLSEGYAYPQMLNNLLNNQNLPEIGLEKILDVIIQAPEIPAQKQLFQIIAAAERNPALTSKMKKKVEAFLDEESHWDTRISYQIGRAHV